MVCMFEGVGALSRGASKCVMLLVHACYAGTHIAGSPFSSHVVAGEVEASNSRLFGAGMQAVQLGRESQLFCELADAFGNRVESSAADGAEVQVSTAVHVGTKVQVSTGVHCPAMLSQTVACRIWRCDVERMSAHSKLLSFCAEPNSIM